MVLTACVSPAPTPRARTTVLVRPAPDGEWDDPGQAAQTWAFDTIQGAIDAASTPSVVEVPSGTYVENLTMRDDVWVQGAGQGETWLVGTVRFSGTISPTHLSHLSAVDPDWYASGTEYTHDGVVVDDSRAVLEDVGLWHFDDGVRAVNDAHLEVSRSTLARNWYGADVQGSVLTFGANLVASNGAGGVVVWNDGSGVVAGNTLVGNAFAATESYLVGALSFGASATPSVAQDNLVVSNYYGLGCSSCSTPFGYNLVWGNTTDYINDAAQKPTDVGVDPHFVNASEGDYHLSPGSAAIDAGKAVGLPVDFEGEARPQGATYDIGMDEFASSSYDLQITEVMANAAVESTGEFVEIRNAGTAAVDLAGLIVSDGDDDDALVAFDGSSTTLDAGAYAVIVDPDYNDDYTIDPSVPKLTTTDSTIGNGLTTSDRVTLFESDGTTIISTFGFPRDPGDGVSMEMVDLSTGDAAGNWRPSQCSGGSSPGAAACFPPSGDPTGLILTEIMANPKVESSGEYVEIYNPTDLEIDAGGLQLTDGDTTDVLQGYQGGSTLVPPHRHALIIDAGYALDYYLPTDVPLLTTGDQTLGNGLSTSDPITLSTADGATVIDTWSSPFDPGDGRSVERIDYSIPDIPSNWQSASVACSGGKSPGRLNGAAGGTCGMLVISEVMANPLNEDTGEFVELYNPGPESVYLAGLRFTDGDTVDTITSYQGGSTMVDPGGYALVVDAEYGGQYPIAAGTVLVTTDDTTLGNSLSVSDDVTLLVRDGEHVIDAYRFPINPGNGTSVERVDLLTTVDSQDNWLPSTCAAGASPGADNCVTQSSSGVDPSDLPIRITEVMANPLDEQTGEFIELYNGGSQSVDLLHFVLYDGDAVDTLFGLNDLYDTVLDPGKYALILDSDYAGQYSIPSGTLLLTTDDHTLASGLATSDPVWLFEDDAQHLVDSYTFPFDPGNGVSVEKQVIGIGDVQTNWAASTCASGSSPGTGNCL